MTVPALRLRRAARRAFGDTSVHARDPEIPVFMGDLIRPWELGFRTDVLDAGRGHTYGEMAEALLPELVGADEPVDVLVLAFGVPDVRPGRSTATYLSSVCPGGPVAFAVCDQGTLSPYTALRLLDGYAPARALLVVAEQSAIHYPVPAEQPLPDRHAAVLLLFDRTGPGVLAGVRQRAGLSTVDCASSGAPAGGPGGAPAGGPAAPPGGPEGAPAGGPVASLAGALAEEVAALAAGRDDVTLVPGAGLAGVALPDGVKVAPGPAGQPHTGAWWALADDPRGLLLLADADPGAGELAVAALDFRTEPGGNR